MTSGGFEFGLRDWVTSYNTTLARGFRLETSDAHTGWFCPVRVPGERTGPVSNWARAESGHTYHLSLALRGSRDGRPVEFGFCPSTGGEREIPRRILVSQGLSGS